MYTTLVPVICRQVLHVNDSQSGTILSLLGAGQMVGDVFASAASYILGPHTTIFCCTLLYGCCLILPAADMALWALMVSSLLQGLFASGTQTPRSELIQLMVPKAVRARLTAHSGGIARMGYIVGPSVAGLIYQHLSVRAVFYFAIPLFVVGAAAVFSSSAMRATERRLKAERQVEEEHQRASGVGRPNVVAASVLRLGRALRSHFAVVGRVGIFALSILALRACRRFLLTLAALQLDLSARDTMFVISGSYAVDALFFWVGAALSDRFGRNCATVPLCVLMGGAFAVLAFADHLALLIVAAGVFGIADCFGAGILLSVIADSVPREANGLTRLVQDSGGLLGPAIAGALSHHVSLRVACLTMAAWSVAVCLWALLMLPAPAALGTALGGPTSASGSPDADTTIDAGTANATGSTAKDKTVV
jgi:MFS family permease